MAFGPKWLLGFAADQPRDYARLVRMRRRIHTPVARLRAEIVRSAEPIPFDRLDRSAFRPLRDGEAWGGVLDCAWIRFGGTVPAAARGNPAARVQLAIRGEALVVDAAGRELDAVSTVFQQGDLPHASGRWRDVRGAVNPTDADRVDGIDTVELYADVNWNGVLLWPLGKGVFHGARIALRDDEAHALYYDYLTLAVLEHSTDDPALRTGLRRDLEAAWAAASRGRTAEARAVLAPALAARSDSPLTYSAIGHGHLDTAWLWPIRETQRKNHRTATRALGNAEQSPGFVMGLSQPQQLDWMRQQRPALFERVKEAVRDGRIEAQGSFWVECDTNMPNGESLVRQALEGRRFWRDEVGLGDDDLRMCWLPDTFGYSGNLPQLLRGSGMEWFQTIKLSWNRVTVFPHRTFRWAGIDGSEVLVHMPPEGDYNSRAAPDGLLRGLRQYPERDLGTALLVYGAGDGGGGPDERHLETTARERDLRGLPRVERSAASTFFRALAERVAGLAPGELPSHRGELYLETHQGTYTTQAAIKRGNRVTERMLHDAEALAALTGRPSAPDELRPHWRNLLLNQFHDILPGSSIERVNREAVALYATTQTALATYAAERIRDLGETHRAPGDTASPEPEALNLSPVPRAEHVGTPAGWRRAEIAPYASAPLLPLRIDARLGADDRTLANDLLELRFASDGSIRSFVDAGGEHARGADGGGLNRLVLHRDPAVFPFDAWDIDARYTGRRPRVLVPELVETRVDGPFAIRRSLYRFGRSRLEQSVIVESGSPLVRFRTSVVWRESHRMLRADFRPTHYGDEVRCEIQFGHLARTTHERTREERAAFEVCAHRWVATDDGERGFALLNDGKYGHRAKSGLLSLALLRSPAFPDPTADRTIGDRPPHRFGYAMRAFDPAAPTEESGLIGVIRDGYRIAAPPVLAPGIALSSAAESTDPGVIVETIKPADDGVGVVVRLYEALGRATTTALRLRLPQAGPDANLVETDLLERPLPVAAEAVDAERLAFGPFQVRTFRTTA